MDETKRNEGSDLDSVQSLRAKAQALYIPGSDQMSLDELRYEIQKAQGGDGGLTI